MVDEKSVHKKIKMKEMGTDHRSKDEELRACSDVDISIVAKKISKH